mmetsp:Transcript_19185/g.41443  ORF Transcript_19185/g.41443 Transcript_19185/m.41443 type:complete len:200 (+) Transcript_19185:801-1400(+)
MDLIQTPAATTTMHACRWSASFSTRARATSTATSCWRERTTKTSASSAGRRLQNTTQRAPSPRASTISSERSCHMRIGARGGSRSRRPLSPHAIASNRRASSSATRRRFSTRPARASPAVLTTRTARTASRQSTASCSCWRAARKAERSRRWTAGTPAGFCAACQRPTLDGQCAALLSLRCCCSPPVARPAISRAAATN